MASVSIPETMKSVQMKNIGGPEVLQYKTDLPVPIPLDGEILVKNDFIGINYVDVFVLLLHIPCLQTNKFPNVLYQILAHQNDGGRSRLIIGREAEGVVVATGPGSVNNLRVGDHMVWLAIGGYAEYTAVPSLIAYPVPSDIEPGIAAASLLQGLFTMSLIHQLVHAAAGGVWMMLCRILKDLGAKTIGTTITAEKMKLAMGNVADYMIKYKEEQYLVKRIEKITGGQGEIIVYDGIGKDQAENNVNVVARHGTIVTYEAVVSRSLLCSLCILHDDAYFTKVNSPASRLPSHQQSGLRRM